MSYETSEEIVDQIWRDLSGQVERTHVADTAREVAAEIGEVKIAAYLPLFVRRLSVERLRRPAQAPAFG